MVCKMFGLFRKKPRREDFVAELLDCDYVPIVSATLNGEKVHFILDTGASKSYINSEDCKKYGVIVGEETESSVSGIGGLVNFTNKLSNVSVKVGDTLLREPFDSMNLRNIASSVKEGAGIRIVGIIGSDNIFDNKWIIDFRACEIRKSVKVNENELS